MTCKEKILSIISGETGYDIDVDDWRKLVAIAYYMGIETATKNVSDRYSNLIKEQRKRANSCRYHNMANEIIGRTEYIYDPNYSGEFTAEFGNDNTVL